MNTQDFINNAEYLIRQFDDWMNEIENYSTRRERALEDTNVILWAKAAWDIQQEKIKELEKRLKLLEDNKE
jgi:polyhydroxyalkanoate synthesis regulator phasin